MPLNSNSKVQLPTASRVRQDQGSRGPGDTSVPRKPAGRGEINKKGGGMSLGLYRPPGRVTVVSQSGVVSWRAGRQLVPFSSRRRAKVSRQYVIC